MYASKNDLGEVMQYWRHVAYALVSVLVNAYRGKIEELLAMVVIDFVIILMEQILVCK